MPKRLKGRPTAGAAYVPFIAAGGWSLLALSIWIAGSGAWTSTVSLCLGAVAAWACFRLSEDGDQSHGAWKVLGAGIVVQCVWLALEASGAD